MITFEHAPQSIELATRPAFAARVMNIVTNTYRIWKNRRDFYRLGEMTDAELADIGLTRSDLYGVSDLSFGSDPTRRLGSIARTRAEVLVRRIA
ncbi:uncharacterized protein YjiS (DUF1127 family) [Mesorhizobium soli]|uniref:DUF1127 domain-containing protein n=1 Tax=Pseudaminobacter soli (ex Li et al. 2025) TaxID=1295366 RepID=UPI002475BB45|nr:DUF1127 domain-containing protein [Mesorhizobium soli]MDH6230296.1 uncharacterized protein YjiS (DUF1127 family) [Mesorhizobium soli]